MPSEPTLDAWVRAAAAGLDEAAVDPRACAELDGRLLQALLGAATRAFAARREAGEDLEAFTADGPALPPTPTDVVVTVSAMLDSASIELIEVGLWQAWGSTTATRRERDG
ncbi:MAG: hypothetical protein ACRDN9_02500 [Streptosporangiaceae bacterium]